MVRETKIDKNVRSQARVLGVWISESVWSKKNLIAIPGHLEPIEPSWINGMAWGLQQGKFYSKKVDPCICASKVSAKSI